MDLTLMWVLVAAVAAPNPDPCSRSSSSASVTPSETAWCRYRAGSFGEAAAIFESELAKDPNDVDARVGLGYSQLQLGNVLGARSQFRTALSAHTGHED